MIIVFSSHLEVYFIAVTRLTSILSRTLVGQITVIYTAICLCIGFSQGA